MSSLPQPLDLRDLGEEPVAAEIEAVAVELDGLRDPADVAVGLEHGRAVVVETEGVRAGQAGGAAAEHGVAHRFALFARLMRVLRRCSFVSHHRHLSLVTLPESPTPNRPVMVGRVLSDRIGRVRCDGTRGCCFG